MADYAQTMASKTGPLSAEQHQQMGAAKDAPMDEQHTKFLETILRMIDAGEIDVYDQSSFLKHEVYDKLSEEWQDKTDLALLNIASQLQNIYLFRVSKQTPDSSPILQAMIEELWQSKQRVEEHHDVFKF